MAYYALFKTNIKHLRYYPRIVAYMQRILALPGIEESASPEHIKAGYYSIHERLLSSHLAIYRLQKIDHQCTY